MTNDTGDTVVCERSTQKRTKSKSESQQKKTNQQWYNLQRRREDETGWKQMEEMTAT